MREDGVLDLNQLVADGKLFSVPGVVQRIDAFIPAAGQESHAANFAELPNGDLMCAWFTGSHEGRNDIDIAVSRLPYGSAQWSRPVLVSDDPARSEQNPVLFPAPDGKLWLFYTAQLTRECTREEWNRRVAAGEVTGGFTMQWTAIIRCRISEDNGHTWGPVETFSSKPSSFCRQPMVVLSNGDWLFPMYYSLEAPGHGDDYTVMRISQDQGATWDEYEVPQSRGRVQASVIELEAGRLIAFFRSRAADRIYVSRSEDYGRTWTPPERTVLPNNNASIQATKLASGSFAMIFNNVSSDNDDPQKTVWPRQRYPVTIALSDDEGRTWPYMRHIDTGDDFCGQENSHLNRRCEYPVLIQTQDGALHAAYSYRGRQCIKYVRVSEAWVRDGQLPNAIK